jgi:hypothetical protein
LPELAHRLRELLLFRRVRKGLCPAVGALRGAAAQFETEGLALPTVHTLAITDEFASCLAGTTFNLNASEAEIRRFEETWGKTVFPDVKVAETVDIRPIWEPARLQHVSILLAHLSSGAATEDHIEIDRLARRLVLRWIAENPFPLGPHYMSAMECGLRILVFAYCLKQLQTLSNAEKASVGAALFEHAWLVSKRLSLYSSVGNHTIAESVGLVFAGGVFRNIGDGRRWIEMGARLLEEELPHQILFDGGPAEQSFNYHRFVLDLYWLAADLLEENHLHDCSPWRVKLSQGEGFLSSFTNHGSLPAIGDSDDGYAIAPGVAPCRPVKAAGHERMKSFAASGYTILTSDTDASLVFDHGPLGMAPYYNHGHADALSILLAKEGQEILVDSGTYRYNGEPEWRRYFKGTRAHNTVTVDGFDQAIQETSFVWSMPYRTELLKAVEEGEVVTLQAINSGYARLRDPVHHKRTVILLNGKNFVVKDTFSGKGTHQFELNFHLHPHAEIQEEDEWLKIRKSKAEISIALLSGDRFTIVWGKESPPFCWYSPRYGVKVASAVLTCPKRGLPGEVTFLTAISTSVDRPDLSKMKEAAW